MPHPPALAWPSREQRPERHRLVTRRRSQGVGAAAECHSGYTASVILQQPQHVSVLQHCQPFCCQNGVEDNPQCRDAMSEVLASSQVLASFCGQLHLKSTLGSYLHMIEIWHGLLVTSVMM